VSLQCCRAVALMGASVALVVLAVSSARVAAAVQAPRVDGETIRRIVAGADEAAKAFFQDSRSVRLRFDYRGDFLTQQDRQSMGRWARGAGKTLADAARRLGEYCRQMEAYEGDDWDLRFGVTGVWRRAHVAAERFERLRCRVDYWLALTLEPDRRDALLGEVVDRCRKVGWVDDNAGPAANGDVDPAMALLCAQCLAQQRNDPSARQRAMKILTDLIAWYRRQRIPPDTTYFAAAIEQLGLLDWAEPGQIEDVRLALERSATADDPGILIRLAFVELRRSRPRSDRLLQGLVDRRPELAGFVGRAVLDDWVERFRLGMLTPAEVSGRTVLEQRLALERLAALPTGQAEQAGAIDAATALGLAEWLEGVMEPPGVVLLVAKARLLASVDPVGAVSAYGQAATSRRTAVDTGLGISSAQIAAMGARLAWDLYLKDMGWAGLARQALALYHRLAGRTGDVDDQLEYAYAVVLGATGDRVEATEAERILKRLRDEGGPCGLAAAVELAGRHLRSEGCGEDCRREVRRELEGLLRRPAGETAFERQARRQAVILYGRLTLAEAPESATAEAVLRLLDGLEDVDGTGGSSAPEVTDLDVAALRAGALRLLGRHPEAVAVLLRVIDAVRAGENTGTTAGPVVPIGGTVVDEIGQVLIGAVARIETWQDRPGFGSLLAGLDRLAGWVVGRMDEGDGRTVVQLAQAECLAIRAQETLTGTGNRQAPTGSSDRVAPVDPAMLVRRAAAIIEPLAGMAWANRIEWVRARARLDMARGRWAEAAGGWRRIAASLRRGGDAWAWWQARYWQTWCHVRGGGVDRDVVQHAVEVLLSSRGDCPAIWKRRLETLVAGR